MIATLRSFISRVPANPDLMVALLLLLAIAMMIMPIPVMFIDALIGFNLGFAILLLMVALYIASPMDFSSLPGVILISTVFRLSLTIATTRLILSEGDAGSIIHTFGDFVIAGNIVVGIVIFLIVTLVQFIVIAKGAERVAEVAARFTLDALPGKQMAIDAELRNGDIDQADARAKRSHLESESQLYGAMDGAMKFVKGDAIASLVVIVINMLGGITIGMLSKGMSFDTALHHYTLLTIGDALIAQIPALLLSITAATIVTRVNGSAKLNLGADIAVQLTASPRALRVAACVLVAMGFIPGFPIAVFLILAAIFAAASFINKQPKEGPAGVAAMPAGGVAAQRNKPSPLPAEALPIVLFLAPDLARAIDTDGLQRHIARISSLVSADLGIMIPRIPVQLDQGLPAAQFRIDVEGVPVEQDTIEPTQLLLTDDFANMELSGIPFRHDPETEKIWIENRHGPALAAAGIGHHDAGEILAMRIHAALVRYAQRFVGIQETRLLLARMEQEYADLVKEVVRIVPVPRIADVLRRLLDEGIPIRNTRLVLEALAEWGEREQNVVLLTEYVRAGLKRQICHRYANAHRVVPAYIIERETEDVVRGAVRDTAVGPYLVLDDRQSEKLLSHMRQIHATIKPGQTPPVILASMDIRRFVRGFLMRNGIDLAVLSYQDLASDFTVQPIGSVKLAASKDQTPALPPKDGRNVLAAAG
ncbi:type III secretion system export apparatus subunit SctV (plasmid) [Bosea vestrisii]|uniref:type III secretion system export apparatus subunit SctV n=1 Tax=Bosea vestrisii TaxID=151416 RepID=UPI0024DFDD39|nr:type III secretion system export apparatus subunit SctV [Bosea vestrisii]WID99716.1 type III secretion system export apparatus subunit SctV [Bosea vestrisii]